MMNWSPSGCCREPSRDTLTVLVRRQLRKRQGRPARLGPLSPDGRWEDSEFPVSAERSPVRTDRPPAWPAAPQAYCARHSGPEACTTRMIYKVQIYNQMTRDAGLKQEDGTAGGQTPLMLMNKRSVTSLF